MKPYYQNELTTIYNADCLDVLKDMKDNSVDLILTDPPYLINYKTNRRKYKDKYQHEIKNDDIKDFSMIEKVLELSYKKLKTNTILALFCSFDYIEKFKTKMQDVGFNIKNVVIWNKGNWTAGDLQAQLGKQYEMILIGHKGCCKFKNDYRFSDIWFEPRVPSEKSVHQNEKPLNIIQRIIEIYTNKGDIVVDTFAGSFTTCVASEQLERKSIGIELEQRYCDIGIKRLNNLQTRLDI